MYRGSVSAALHKCDDGLLVVASPSSLHHPMSAIEYAQKLNELRIRYLHELEIVMRRFGV